MSKEMIISVNGREKKIAILDNGKVTEFYIERGEENSGIAGNIYKGRVQRVLPGMQSAFVSIGLERDAFLYVSDFFDEEEEIERIVMEKSKKISPEEAKREADDQIARARIEREKQMEAVQEIAEPMSETEDDAEGDTGREADVVHAAPEPARDAESEKRGRGRSRRGRGRDNEERPERPQHTPVPVVEEATVFEMDDSGFERIIDDEDTGDLFKDAYRQEAIVDKVRAVEFDIEPTTVTEVGSLLADVAEISGGFERIADEDEDAAPVKAKRKPAKSKAAKPAAEADAEVPAAAEAEAKPKKKSKPAPKPRGAKAKQSLAGTKKGDDGEVLEDGEASVKDAGETAEMTVRRGGRGRRRGGRGRRPDGTEGNAEDTEGAEGAEAAGDDEVESSAAVIESTEPEMEKAEAAHDADQPEADAPAEAQKERNEPRAAREPRESRSPRESRGGGRDGRRDSRSDARPDARSDSRAKAPQADNARRNERSERSDRNDRGDRGSRPQQPTISDLLREGQEILVQIAKEPIARKGARITSHIALPGRFLVYMPTIEHLGVSRKIESASERSRLRTLIQRIRQDETIPSGGFIVRTAGVGISEEDLRQDARYLVRTWQDIRKGTEKAKSPALVHQDLDLVQRLLRDHLSDEFTAIRVDSEEEYLRTVEFINRMQPKMVNRVKLYTREDPILEAYGVQEEIDKALKPRVWLRSGGYLVINQTEALVAIDVNTGKFVGKGNARLEDTITRTNMEAVDEIARQIRLRDLGGIIVLDLIDMEDRRNRHKVSQALQEALQDDKSPTKVLSFNDFGLIIMTRKRVKQSLERTMCAPCDYCEGAGWVKSPTTVCYEILSEARRLSRQLDDVRQTTLRIHPDVAKSLRTSESFVLEEIEAYLGNVDLTADPAIHQAQFDFAFI
ncbi:MAG: Rne/Rng family ribonuclease [Acidobacteriota bacterium]